MSTKTTTLSNGVRVVTIRMPHLDSVKVGVFVRTGSRNETQKLNGISHFLEHMAFKGTETRDCRTIALTCERLGASMNAYTSKDTTCYYMSGLAKHTPILIDMLADMVQNNIFPEDELERERQVIIQEFNQYEDDASSSAYNLYDEACFGTKQAMGRTILGPKKNILGFKREDFQNYVNNQYTAQNIVVGVAGNIDHDDVVRQIEDLFSDIPSGEPNVCVAPLYQPTVKIKKKAAFTQSTIVMGWPIATLHDDYYSDVVMASVLGHGMSSPLFTEIREKRGLAYHISSGQQVNDNIGQLFITAQTTPEHLDEFFNAVCDIVKTVATKVDPVDLERAINTLSVGVVTSMERGFSQIEAAADDIFTFGEINDHQEELRRIGEVTCLDVQSSIDKMLVASPSMSIVGKGADARFYDQFKYRLI